MRRHIAYLKYVLRHKWWVFWACMAVGEVPLWRAIFHDWTKFLPCEWFPYARQFYFPDGSKRGRDYKEDSFDSAWNHHQKANPHHWQYWVLQKDDGGVQLILPPETYLREMVADWVGAGMAICGRNDVMAWYKKNKDKIKLHPRAADRVRQILNRAQSFFEEKEPSHA